MAVQEKLLIARDQDQVMGITALVVTPVEATVEVVREEGTGVRAHNYYEY